MLPQLQDIEEAKHLISYLCEKDPEFEERVDMAIRDATFEVFSRAHTKQEVFGPDQEEQKANSAK